MQYPQERRLPSNADLQDLLAKAMTRLENWRLELETNPNPRMVHALRNILGHMESIARVAETKAAFSYKHLSRQMSLLFAAVAELNLAITEALDDDDVIDAREEQRIERQSQAVVENARANSRPAFVQHGCRADVALSDVPLAVAELNLAITEALDDDDVIDAREEQRINASLKRVVETAVELIRIVQHGFVLSRRFLDGAADARPAVGAGSSAEENL